MYYEFTFSTLENAFDFGKVRFRLWKGYVFDFGKVRFRLWKGTLSTLEKSNIEDVTIHSNVLEGRIVLT